MFAVAGVAWLLFVAAASYIAGYHDCAVYGPYHPLAYSLEASPVIDRFVMWPLGRECGWETADGTTVLARAGWGPTVAMVCIGAVSLWGLAIAAVPLQPRRGGSAR
ncbi:hypothetical protein B0I08_1094 [Glaciihabitans tibetensis]|uniref:Uncharacterized protein n=1 Tax=Glaciihabitans tibetensis TaxID=1266600 RepID=A0A2T0V6Q4_9MICO|nr:hypothetical protein [Glaciihabitans tibetensis]PRY65856.1 hypothetical protein B0I08_1094 [Glaciihabitans tibetensis]